MSIVTITLGNRDFKLSCPKEGQDILISLSKKLDLRIDEAKANNPSASFELLLIIAALGLIDENQSQKSESVSNTDSENLQDSNNIDYKHTLSELLCELNFVAKKLEK